MFLQVIIKVDWNKESTVLKGFQSMCQEVFEKEGIYSDMYDIIEGSIVVICEVFMEDIIKFRRIVLADKRRLHQRGIIRIDLEYYTKYGSILVSFV